MTNTSNTFRIIQLSPKQQKELSEIKSTFSSLLLSKMEETKQNNAKIDLSSIWTPTENLPELYEQLTNLKNCLDSFRPFNQAQLENLQEVFDTEYTYESNHIEGNSLTLFETDLVINKGITIDGKPLKDHFEAVNHLDGIHYIREIAQSQITFNEKVLLEIHRLILQGIDRHNAGFYRRTNVRISGSQHTCPNYPKVPHEMEKYFSWFAEQKEKLNPVKLAAEAHRKLVSIHPFIDGNGRTARLVMNLILLQHGYPITIISSEKSRRKAYYDALEASHQNTLNDSSVFERLIAKYVKTWIFTYLDLIAPNGGEEDQNKGYTFFKKIEPYLDSLNTDKSTND